MFCFQVECRHLHVVILMSQCIGISCVLLFCLLQVWVSADIV